VRHIRPGSALIAAVIVTAVRLIGTNLTSVFNKVANGHLTGISGLPAH
jgi:Flp pilus assembly pilin Flp